MKRLFPIFTFLLCYSINVCAQQQNVQGPIKKIDTLKKNMETDSIVLSKALKFEKNVKPTFTKSSQKLIESGKSSGANVQRIAPSPIDPWDSGDSGASSHSPVDPLIATITDAGRTASSVDVSSTGSSVYTVPITLPPGIGNAVPQLAFSYNSQAGNGIGGVGWSISGLSSITRIPATSFHDNRIGGINLDPNDRFALDGQRLILKSGTYGADGAEYQTENYSNIRIFSRGTFSYGANLGPSYFEVWLPDGNKSFYGYSSDSRTPNNFAITYTETPLGARTSYTYTLQDNIPTINQIGYGGIGSSAQPNLINFTYTPAHRSEMVYMGGTSFAQNKLISKISVVANGVNFRNYRLTYTTMVSLYYSRIQSIVESNGDGSKEFSPINFTYNSTGEVTTSTSISNLSLSGIASNNSEVLTADFTGNGSMDFLLYPKNTKDRFYAFYDMEPGSPYMQLGYEINTGRFRDIFPATWLTWNNKVLPGQGMLLVKDNYSNQYKFEMYSSGTTSPVYFQYDREWVGPISPDYYSDCDQQMHPGYRINMEFLSGDFNGDGLTDLVGVNDGSTILVAEVGLPPDDPMYYPGNCQEVREYTDCKAYFFNMDRRLTNSNYITDLGILTKAYYLGDRLYASDMNGDGRTDIVLVKTNSMHVYTIEDNAIKLLWSTSDSRIRNDYQALLGDYNGDGKADIMFSTGNSSLFATFMSTGKSFEKYEQYMPFATTAGVWDGTNLNLYYLVPNDINGDGKTDIISARTTTQNNNAYGSTTITVFHNLDMTSGPQFSSGNSISTYAPLMHYPIPVFLSPDRLNQKLEFGFMSNNNISMFKFQKDFRTEALLTGINQDGVSHTIEYKGLVNDQSYAEMPIYQSGYDQIYPYVDIENSASTSVVSKITRNFNSEQVSQLFGYGGAVTHLGGLGFQGFGELIRSNWHQNSSDVNRNFTISIFDPLLRGAMVRSFLTKSAYLNPTIKDLSVTAVPSSAVADGASINDYITRSDQIYQTRLLPNKVFINSPIGNAFKDLLANNYSTQKMEYDNYYNTTKTINNFNGSGAKQTETTYDNNLSGYYIGRPLTNKTTLTKGADNFVTQDEYTYTGWLVSQIRQKSNNSVWVTENMVHDSFGNVTQKTTTAPNGNQRVANMQYDLSGRFITQFTDEESQVTSSTYNQSTGNVLSTTNPGGFTQTFVYDTWGRLITSTNQLNVASNRTYQADNANNIIISDIDDEGRTTISTVNPLGQTIETKNKNVLGQFIGKAFQYDVYGRQIAESQPAQPGNYTQWNQSVYDQYGRLKQTTSYTGKITNISYSGMTITTADGVKTVTTTKNAMGQVENLQDGGGSINFSYYANGNLKTAEYGGFVQSIEQDAWGRRTKFVDPSAGEYSYQYDGWGQLAKEINPKGYTEYSYTTGGKLSQKKLVGDHTNIQCDYTYNPTSKLLASMVLTNADGNNATYTYDYDSNRRLIGTIEDNTHARFVKGYTYDNYGRIISESYEAKNKANNLTAQKTIEMQYAYGELLKTTLQGTGQVLWEVTSLTSKGQLAEAMQGTMLKNTFQYDAYGMPQQNKVDNISANSTLQQLNYNFNAQRGILDSRSNSALGWSETFSYDNLDRLTNFNDNLGNNSQTYDNRGRIINNSQLGTYSYDSGSYKQTELDLSNNATANTYYQADHPLQQISYNAFKSPVEIIEDGKERISFQYNASLNRSHMYYGDDQVDKELRRFRRHYSEDGGMEITHDIQTGKTSFIFYLGGDPYSAPAIWKEEYVSGTSTQNLYFLHRDHLGSIVMITNDQGAVVEKRQFDAWGNVVKIQDGMGNNLAAFVILDRGFTGHEHLLGVGLINMNGRLYDPKLHRFLSPDNFVQELYNTQNYNRYGYAMNNPLSYIDPSGEFLWAFVAIGAIIGAITGGVSYAASAIRTGDWSWGALGRSMLTGAIIGGITGGANPSGIFGASLGKTFLSAFASGLIPSFTYTDGKFSFSISPSIVFGKSFGFGANLSVGFGSKWNLSGGVGIMYYGNYQSYGKSGLEIRESLMAGYSSKTFGLTVATSFWQGTGDMKEFTQRTTVANINIGKFKINYDNDGSPFSYLGKAFSNDTDMYRTNSVGIGWGEYSLQLKMFTGRSGSDSNCEDCIDKNAGRQKWDKETNAYKRLGLWKNPEADMYRLGAISFSTGNYNIGLNGEPLRDAFQNWFAHKFISAQPGFRMLSTNLNPYFQYQTLNTFTRW